MKRTVNSWEYKVIDTFRDEESLEELLNRYGRDGWELVQFSTIEYDTVFLKRFRGQIEIE